MDGLLDGLDTINRLSRELRTVASALPRVPLPDATLQAQPVQAWLAHSDVAAERDRALASAAIVRGQRDRALADVEELRRQLALARRIGAEDRAKARTLEALAAREPDSSTETPDAPETKRARSAATAKDSHTAWRLALEWLRPRDGFQAAAVCRGARRGAEDELLWSVHCTRDDVPYSPCRTVVNQPLSIGETRFVPRDCIAGRDVRLNAMLGRIRELEGELAHDMYEERDDDDLWWHGASEGNASLRGNDWSRTLQKQEELHRMHLRGPPLSNPFRGRKHDYHELYSLVEIAGTCTFITLPPGHEHFQIDDLDSDIIEFPYIDERFYMYLVRGYIKPNDNNGIYYVTSDRNDAELYWNLRRHEPPMCRAYLDGSWKEASFDGRKLNIIHDQMGPRDAYRSHVANRVVVVRWWVKDLHGPYRREDNSVPRLVYKSVQDAMTACAEAVKRHNEFGESQAHYSYQRVEPPMQEPTDTYLRSLPSVNPWKRDAGDWDWLAAHAYKSGLPVWRRTGGNAAAFIIDWEVCGQPIDLDRWGQLE